MLLRLHKSETYGIVHNIDVRVVQELWVGRVELSLVSVTVWRTLIAILPIIHDINPMSFCIPPRFLLTASCDSMYENLWVVPSRCDNGGEGDIGGA